MGERVRGVDEVIHLLFDIHTRVSSKRQTHDGLGPVLGKFEAVSG